MEQDPTAELCRTGTPHGLAAFYELIFSDMGWTFPAHLMPVAQGFCDTRINKLMLIIGPGSGKSQMLSIAVPAWVIGRNPNATVLGVSGGEALMQGFQKATMSIVEQSLHWRRVFPDVRPDKGAGWSTEGGMFVTGRRPGLPDASYLACGIDSKYLTGKHGSLIIIDDLHNEENSSTAEQCERVVQKYAKTIVGRADPMGARFLMAGRRWHQDDIYGQLKSSGWVVLELPAEREGSRRLFYDVFVPDGMECVFTDRQCRLADGTMVPA
jgi:hypothetical protein